MNLKNLINIKNFYNQKKTSAGSRQGAGAADDAAAGWRHQTTSHYYVTGQGEGRAAGEVGRQDREVAQNGGRPHSETGGK